MHKIILRGIEARNAIERGISVVAESVACTLGPKGRNVIIQGQSGPIVTKDGVTVAKSIELECPYENLGAQLCRQVSSKTNDVAGDGTTTATVLANAIAREGLRYVTAGGSPISLKRGIDKAVDAVVEIIAAMSKPIENKEEVNFVATISGNEQEVGDIVKKIGLPYDEINTDVLKDVNVKTFSVPKLVVYSQQTEPYIHIDLDTFIFKKIFFNDFENIYSTFAEGSGDILNFERTNTSFYTTYIKRSFEIQNKLPEEFLKYVKFNNVPNMSVFGGHNFELIKESSKYCLQLYQNHTDFFDSNYYNACIIEQLFIPAAMRMIKGDHNLENFKFLCKKQ
jgi:hypothetical protein